MEFDYYYGSQADQFSFIRIPRMLLREETFSSLTLQSKMLYSVLLDRMSLSMKNGWFDEENRVYIIYQISEIQSDLGFSKRKAMDYLAELEQDASPIVEEESSVNSPQEQDIEIIEKPVGEPCTAASDPFVGRPPIIDEQPVIREAPAKQRAIMPEGFELLYSVLGGEFSEKEIGYLYKTARRKFLLSGRSVDEQDGMLTDYVLYYHDKMDATSEQTKTTPYNRLFDMVRKDYDGQAQEITVRYSYE